MAGVPVGREELESDVAATAAVAATRRTNIRNNFFVIHSVLPKDQVERSWQKILIPGIGSRRRKIPLEAFSRFGTVLSIPIGWSISLDLPSTNPNLIPLDLPSRIPTASRGEPSGEGSAPPL